MEIGHRGILPQSCAACLIVLVMFSSCGYHLPMPMVPHNGPPAPRGRGAQSNATGRFESLTREAFDDGWTGEDEAPAQLKTVVTPERSKTIIARNDSPDVGFDRSINPYRGCEHGCIYCYARPSHAYVGLSPGLDFESRIFFKPEAGQLLAKELAKPSYRAGPIHIGGN